MSQISGVKSSMSVSGQPQKNDDLHSLVNGDEENAPPQNQDNQQASDQAGQEPSAQPHDDGEGELAEQAALASLQEKLSALEAEKSDFNDRLLRAHAEMQNLRKRTEKEIRDARQYAIANFARDLLAVADNFERALETLPEHNEEDPSSKALEALIEGVAMTRRELLNVMERNGIYEIDAQDQPFDPNAHQAMFEVQNESIPRNTVVQVVQKGYTIGNRTLRPAMVGVSRGGPRRSEMNQDRTQETPVSDKNTDSNSGPEHHVDKSV
jgi:molecular chaperone GrpE